MSLPKIRKDLESLKLAKEKGYAVPQELIDHAESEYRKAQKMVQVWECTKCKDRLETWAKLKSVECGNDGYLMKKIWETTETFQV